MGNSAVNDPARDQIDVIVPNLNWRYSGVTATNRTIAPLMAKQAQVFWLGPYRPEGVARLGIFGLFGMRFAVARNRIWHARRNVEMLTGLILKWLGFRFVLVFTSVAQRRHTGFTRFLIARMDAVITTSEASAENLGRPATVVPHGVDAAVFCPPPDRAAAFAASGLPGRYGIGAFGRVRPQKGTDVFIAAMCALLPKYPDFTAIVVGRVTVEHLAFAAALRRQVEAAGLGERIKFLGEVPIAEVPRWYQRVTIYAFTSRNEGFGLTLLESMAAGNALVAARAGAAEQVVAEGKTGMLVPAGDVDALVAALEPLMREPARAAAMGSRARERVVAEFSVEVEAARIAAVYRAALASAQH